MRIALSLFWVLAGVTLIGWLRAESEKKPVSLTVNPRVGMVRQSLCVSVIVPRHADNRILATEIDCDGLYRSWQEQLRGDSAPYHRRTCVESMPAGPCAIGAALYRLDATRKGGIAIYSAQETACFLGGAVSCE